MSQPPDDDAAFRALSDQVAGAAAAAPALTAIATGLRDYGGKVDKAVNDIRDGLGSGGTSAINARFHSEAITALERSIEGDLQQATTLKAATDGAAEALDALVAWIGRSADHMEQLSGTMAGSSAVLASAKQDVDELLGPAGPYAHALTALRKVAGEQWHAHPGADPPPAPPAPKDPAAPAAPHGGGPASPKAPGGAKPSAKAPGAGGPSTGSPGAGDPAAGSPSGGDPGAGGPSAGVAADPSTTGSDPSQSGVNLPDPSGQNPSPSGPNLPSNPGIPTVPKNDIPQLAGDRVVSPPNATPPTVKIPDVGPLPSSHTPTGGGPISLPLGPSGIGSSPPRSSGPSSSLPGTGSPPDSAPRPSTLPGEATPTSGATGRGGAPFYPPPTGGLGAGARGGGAIKPGAAERSGGPELGGLGGPPGKPVEEIGVPSGLRGRGAGGPSGPGTRPTRTPRRSGRKPGTPPVTTAAGERGEVLDEQLWRVEPPAMSDE